MISAVASDEMFGYWTSCCSGSEKIPKILKFIRHISFERETVTAAIDFMKGDLKIGVAFFMDHIQGPEDLLFILIHERNHLILRKLYPNVNPGPGYPKELFNFGEDAFINAISRRYIPSTLPERYYRMPVALLLTGLNSRINWDLFSVQGDMGRRMRDVHGTIYRDNHRLLKAINETQSRYSFSSGYAEWMALIGEWHAGMKDNKGKNRPTLTDMTAVQEKSRGDGEKNKEPADFNEEGDTKDADEKAQEDVTTDSEGTKGGETDVEEGEDVEDDGLDEAPGSHQEAEDWDDETDLETNDVDEKNVGRDAGHADIDSVLRQVVPLVQAKDMKQGSHSGGQEYRDPVSGISKIPMPDFKPNDLEVKLILETSELLQFRYPLRAIEGDALAHVEGMIRGMLSDRATERSYDGYSLSVPLSITRRDVFALASGDPPVMWQRRVGVERPCIDLYVDVSGSMRPYYLYIPFIYEALKHVMGRIFQFSTVVREVSSDDRFLYSTGGTDFDRVADHMTREGVRAAILLSDGKSSISSERLQTLKGQLQSLVYIKIGENEHKNWEDLANQVIIINQ